MEKLAKFFKSILPGIFLVGFCIGTGSVTTMAKSGATYGMSLLWAILLSCIITFFLISVFSRVTMITGDTALASFKKHIHPAASLFLLCGLTFCIFGSIIGVIGIITDVSFVWSKNFIPDGIKPIYWAFIYIFSVYVLFLKGNTQFFEKVLAILVGVMGICFLFNFFMLMPSISSIVKGLIPSIPNIPSSNGVSPFLVAASMVGTTAFAGLFVIRTRLVKEAGWKLQDAAKQRKDALIMAVVLFLINGSIIAAGASTLYTKGIDLQNASQMVELLRPTAGAFASIVFGLGIIAAGISSQFPNIMFLPWMICDYTEKPIDMKQKKYRIIVFLMSLLGFIVPVFHAKPVFIMILASVFGSLILPVAVICIFIVGNKKKAMKEHTFSLPINIILTLIFIFSLIMSYNGLKGLIISLIG